MVIGQGFDAKLKVRYSEYILGVWFLILALNVIFTFK